GPDQHVSQIAKAPEGEVLGLAGFDPVSSSTDLTLYPTTFRKNSTVSAACPSRLRLVTSLRFINAEGLKPSKAAPEPPTREFPITPRDHVTVPSAVCAPILVGQLGEASPE